MKKQEYIKPEIEIICVNPQSSVCLASRWTPPVDPGTYVPSQGNFEFIGEGEAGDEAEAKKHSNWDTWGDYSYESDYDGGLWK